MPGSEEVSFGIHGRVEILRLDEELQDHLSGRDFFEKHAVRLAEIAEVHAGRPKYFVNEGANRRALLIMVGPTLAGRFLCVPIEPNGPKATWRAVTAFEANAHHRRKYGEHHGRTD